MGSEGLKKDISQAVAAGPGVRMPMGQVPVADADLNLRRVWIDAGAPNNWSTT